MNEEGSRFSAARTEFHSPEFKDVVSGKPTPLPKFDVPIETVFTESTLKNLKSAFDKGSATLDRFMDEVIKLLALDKDYSAFAIPKLFNAVDTYRRGTANLCEYSYEDYQRRDIWMGEPKGTSLVVLGRVIGPKLHRPPPVKILERDDVYLLFSKDGTVSYWSNSFKVGKSKSVNTGEIEEERLYGKLYCDVCVAESLGKLIVSTSDKEMQFFDLQSLEPCCQIHGLPSSVLFVHLSGMSNAANMKTSENLYVFEFRKNRVDGESEASDAGPAIAGHYNELPDVWITCFNLTLKTGCQSEFADREVRG